LNKQLDPYLERLVNVDMKDAGVVIRQPEALMPWLRAYAASVATTTSWDKLRDAASVGEAKKPSKGNAIRYTEAISRLRILDEIPPWLPGNNHLSRLGQSPKRFLADPALAARPADRTFLGALFESLVALSLSVFCDANAVSFKHLRTWSGDHEVDFIVAGPGGQVIAIEAKLSNTVHSEHVEHLTWIQHKLGDKLLDSIVVNTGSDAYRRKDGIAVVPLGLLGP
jgi:predicted AAA+ superfamily ATPase